MIIACPQCQSQYRINPAAGSKAKARVRCPNCQHTFEITLAAEPPVAAAETPVVRPEPQAGGSAPLVLVVDDARYFREMIRDILAELPIRLETAADGSEALAKIQSLQPDLLLLDLNIPGLSGQELIAAVRRDPALRALRILAMSAVQRGEDAAHDLRRLGAEDFISKSFKPRDLQSRVRQLLGL